MAGIKTILSRRLTAREAVGVVVALGALAAGGYCGYNFVTAKILESKVEAALPGVCAAVREQRVTVVKALESYKKQFGFYPPDNVVSRQPLAVNSYTNPLLYELVGTVVDTNGYVKLGDDLDAAPIDYIKRYLNSTGFVNSGSSTGAVKQFLSLERNPVRQLHDDPDVFAVGIQGTTLRLLPWEIASGFKIGPWQYVSSGPVHNPGKYDLWIEVKTKKRSVTVGNWKEVE